MPPNLELNLKINCKNIEVLVHYKTSQLDKRYYIVIYGVEWLLQFYVEVLYFLKGPELYLSGFT